MNSKLELDNNPILERDLFDDKVGVLDIRAKIDNQINTNIEMQMVDKKDIEKRILFYWSKMYSGSIKKGEPYDVLGKNIVILISNYDLESIKEIPKYVTKWNIREKEYSKIILTEVMEIYIIEVSKFDKYNKEVKNKELNRWIKFIKNPEVVEMSETNKAIQQAKEVLEEISQDKRERYLAEMREKYIRDQKATEGAGYDKGAKDKTIEIAKKLKEQDIGIEIISQVTGLTKEEIEKI